MPMKDNVYHTAEVTIDIYDILRHLVKDIWLIILIGVSSAMCANVAANLLYKPVYTASAMYVVTTKGSNDIYGNLSAANNVAETITSILSSNVLANKVALDLGMDTVPGTVSAYAIEETNLLGLTVSASSPMMAYQIITSVMNNYTSVSSNIFKNVILNVMEAPVFPTYPDNYVDEEGIMKKAFVLGMVVMTALLIVLSINRDNIKNEKDITKKLDTKLLGIVYHENKNKTLRTKLFRKKKSILINSPTVSFPFVENIKKIRAKLEYKVGQTEGNVILVTSVLENEGKSTIATNLALALAQKSFNVLLIDSDLCKPSIYKVLEKKVEKEQEIGNCIKNHCDVKEAFSFDPDTGLYLLIGSEAYKNSTDLLASESFQELIKETKNLMDYIIVDAPPMSVAADAEVLADVVDASLLVIRQSTAHSSSINDSIDILTNCKSEYLGCIFNNVHNSFYGLSLHGQDHYSSNKYYGHYKTKRI